MNKTVAFLYDREEQISILLMSIALCLFVFKYKIKMKGYESQQLILVEMFAVCYRINWRGGLEESSSRQRRYRKKKVSPPQKKMIGWKACEK